MCRSIHWPEASDRRSPGGIRVGIRLPERRGRIYWRLPIAVLAVVLTVGFSCSKKSEADLANEALQQGIAAQNAGRLAEAAADYREVLVHDPNNKYAYFDLGTIDQANGALASAESNYRFALNIDPAFTNALFNLAIVRHDLGDLKESISLYRQVIELDPGNASAHLNLGFALIEAHQDQEGQRELKKAVQLNPDFADRVKAVTATASPNPSESLSPSSSPS
jgi:tetratricopeptide (TPR) repeat protein